VLAAWIAGLVTAGALLWGILTPVRERALMKSVNRFLQEKESVRYAIKALHVKSAAAPMGTWFLLEGRAYSGRFVVFTIFSGGLTIPFAAVITGNEVESVFPLTPNGEALLPRIEGRQLETWIARLKNYLASGQSNE
jgi:hypothetical protein